MIFTRTLVLVTALTGVGASTAMAANVYVAVASGTWNDPAHWERVSGSDLDTYPVAGDTAIVANVTIIVDAAAAVASLEVSKGGSLQVNWGDTLRIGSGHVDGSTSRVEVNGTMVLDGGTLKIEGGELVVNAGGVLRMEGVAPRLDVAVADGVRLLSSTSVLEIRSSAVVAGSGSLQGGDVDAAIVVAVDGPADVELTIEDNAAIHGGLTLKREGIGTGIAKLENHGQVKSDKGMTILVDASLDQVRDDGGTCGTPNWYVDSGATMRFAKAATTTSAFRIDGTLIVDGVPLSTSGKVCGRGTVRVLLPGSFCHAGGGE